MRQFDGRRGFSDSFSLAFDFAGEKDLNALLLLEGIDECLITAAAPLCNEGHDIIDVLYRQGHLSAEQCRKLRAKQQNCLEMDQAQMPRNPNVASELSAVICARQRVMPWMRLGGRLVLASARPDQQAAHWADAPEDEVTPILAAAKESDITQAIMESYGTELAARAVQSVDSHESSLTVMESVGTLRIVLISVLGAFAVSALLAPSTTFIAFTLASILALYVLIGLKALAFVAQYIAARRSAGLRLFDKPTPPAPPEVPEDKDKPVVSLLVPLHKERLILPRLVARLSALDWPKHLLDVKLVVEADDDETLSALDEMDLPNWIHIVPVPDGQPKTKPRAMNIAVDFCHGEFIGIYDAEDRPEPDQIARMVETFNKSGPQVACLQGILDYYNTQQNWLARCFTIEYASWFRVILPGIEHLGLPVPLGGTTLFFRRQALEDLGRWDAHNVTEDADLGIRINRHGLRTAMMKTATYEEANCFVWPWVKQRSRWLKGYMLTWLVHMQTPMRLHQELGLRRHVGFQCLFLSTNLMFLLAPFLWSFWPALFGWNHPAADIIGEQVFFWIMMSFFFAEIIHLLVSCTAVSGPDRRYLMKWVPSMHFYYVLGSFAAYKALWELITDPFYWDKTAHGHSLDLVDD